MATVLEEQEAMQQDNTLMDRPLKKIQHVQQANLCLSMSKEHFYAKIKLPTNFAGVENLSDLTTKAYLRSGNVSATYLCLILAEVIVFAIWALCSKLAVNFGRKPF